MRRELLVAAALRAAGLALVALLAASAAWGLAAAARQPAAGTTPVTPAERALAAARARPATVTVPVSVAIDGIRRDLTVAGRTVADVVRVLGIELGPGDRLSLPLDEALTPGMHLAIDRGIPVTVVDGGREVRMRAAPGALVSDFLAAAGVAIDGDDRLATPSDAAIALGTVIRIHRSEDREVEQEEAVPFGVRYESDPAVPFGRVSTAAPGVPGLALRVYLINYFDGAETERVLLSETVLREPVAEVRVRGTKPPPAPALIEEIIRAAAARWGADPEQLLRVAWCESRFNPDAYNPSHNDSGLFQFIPTTWAHNAPRAGYAGVSPFDPVANANTAAMLFAEGKASLWTCK